MNLDPILEFISGLTIGEIIGDSALLVFALASIIEITPIKWDPLTAILSWFGARLNKRIQKDVEVLTDSVNAQAKKTDDLAAKLDMNEIDRIRWEILNFSNSCRHGVRHTKDEFVHIIDQHDKYNKILKDRSLKNGLITLEYEYIEDIYKQCLEKNSFL